MKKEGRFDDVIKSVGPIVGDLRKKIEEVTWEEMGLNNPIFKTDVSKNYQNHQIEEASENKVKEHDSWGDGPSYAGILGGKWNFTPDERQKYIEGLRMIVGHFNALEPELSRQEAISRAKKIIYTTVPDIPVDIVIEVLGIT